MPVGSEDIEVGEYNPTLGSLDRPLAGNLWRFRTGP